MTRFMAALAALVALCFTAPAQSEPNETAQTVAQCRANHDSCRESIGLAVVLGGKWCAPEDMVVPTDAELDAVLTWLEAHPQVEPDDWEAASSDALEALYPCPK